MRRLLLVLAIGSAVAPAASTTTAAATAVGRQSVDADGRDDEKAANGAQGRRGDDGYCACADSQKCCTFFESMSRYRRGLS